MKILFFGSGEFSIQVLQKVLKSQHEVVAVVCQVDKVSGRGKKINMLPVKKFALEKGLKVLQFDKVNLHVEEIFSLDFDLCVTASFGQIISKDMLEQKMWLNVHPSALPHLRGATPLQTALLNGEKEIGVTIQKMAWEVDSGDVAVCKMMKVCDVDNFSTLSQKSGELGGELLCEVLDNLQNNCQDFKVQNHKDATFTKMIQKDDGRLDFSQSAICNVNKVRALGENPGCYFYILGERIKVKKATVFSDESLDLQEEILSGQIFHNKNLFLIKASDKFVSIEICQAENGKMLDCKSFLNGYKFKSERVD